MSPGRHETLRRLFDEALDCPEDQRFEFCAERCGGDEGLRRELESLLEQVPSASGHGVSFDSIGPYRVDRALACGGMARVFVAHEPPPLARRVAIKLLRTDLGSQAAIERFRTECQLLARLTHPGIAQVYHAGTVETGRPWFAMEFVDGPQIHHFVRDEALDPYARLDLIEQVGAALGYAHQKGVLHLDIKPSNVLVAHDAEGRLRAKLIDFGIGRDLDRPGSAPTRPIGSPAYMSPEQLDPSRAGEVDARSDVFALGVLMFELMAERKLFEAGVARDDDGHRPALSTVSGIADVRLAASLDVVIAQATACDPESRYASVADMTDAIAKIRAHAPGRSNLRRAVLAGFFAILGFGVGYGVDYAAHSPPPQPESEESVFASLLEWTALPFGFVEGGALDRVDHLLDTVAFDRPVDEAMALYAVGRLHDDVGQFRRAAARLEESKRVLIRAGRTDLEPMFDIVARLGRLRGCTDALVGDALEVSGVLVERVGDADAGLGDLLAEFVNGMDRHDSAAVFRDLEQALADSGIAPVVRGYVAEVLCCAARHYASVGLHPVEPILSLEVAQRDLAVPLLRSDRRVHCVRLAAELVNEALEALAAGDPPLTECVERADLILRTLESLPRVSGHQRAVARSLRESWRVVAGDSVEPSGVEAAYRGVASAFSAATSGPCREAARRWLLASIATGGADDRARAEFVRIEGMATVQPARWAWREPAFRSIEHEELCSALRDLDAIREERVQRWSAAVVEERVSRALLACDAEKLDPPEALLCSQQLIAACRHDRGAITQDQRGRIARHCLVLSARLAPSHTLSVRRLAALELARASLYEERFADAVRQARKAMELSGSQSGFEALYPRSILVEGYAGYDSVRAKREALSLRDEVRESLPPQHAFAAYAEDLCVRVCDGQPPR